MQWTNQNSRQIQLASSKNVSHSCFWFYFWLVDNVAQQKESIAMQNQSSCKTTLTLNWKLLYCNPSYFLFEIRWQYYHLVNGIHPFVSSLQMLSHLRTTVSRVLNQEAMAMKVIRSMTQQETEKNNWRKQEGWKHSFCILFLEKK